MTAQSAITWSDLDAGDAWARPAINAVAGAEKWMRDTAPDAQGVARFRPDSLERRSLFARALVRAFVPPSERTVDPSIRFPDFKRSLPLSQWANIAVGLGWMGRTASGGFNPNGPVTTIVVHRALIDVLGLRDVAKQLNALSTTNGYVFAKPAGFGPLLLGMRLGLRFDNDDESQDVGPRTPLVRKQVAYSLWRAATLDDGTISWIRGQYEHATLPRMGPTRRAIVEWGLRYVGYPYVWGGEWGFDTTPPGGFGSQPVPGFDCSGLTWWTLKADDGGAWDVAPPRPYAGWNIAERSSAQMATKSNFRRFDELRIGDMAFYDGDGDGTVDHVDVYVGSGWALDSSGGAGGVTLMWIGDGWYRDHFVSGRHLSAH